jgi:hypothetical protein
MLNTDSVTDDSKNWKLSEDILTPSSSTTPAPSTTPDSATTPAPSSTPDSTTAPDSPITPSPSDGLSQPDAPGVSSISTQTERQSTTLASDMPTTLVSDMPKSSNPSESSTVSSTAGQIRGPSASDIPRPKKGVAPAVIGGGVTGGVVGVALILLLCLWYFRWRPRKRRKEDKRQEELCRQESLSARNAFVRESSVQHVNPARQPSPRVSRNN